MSIAQIHITTQEQEMNRTQWNDLVNRSHSASFFQTPECYDFYASLSFLKPFVFGISQGGKLQGVAVGYIIADGGLIKRYFSRRAIIPGGLLLNNNISDEALNLFLMQIKAELESQAIYIEIRNNNDYSAYKQIFQTAGFTYQAHLNYQISLKDEKTVYNQFSRSKKRQIKQAENAGVYWEETKNDTDIECFYVILQGLYKSKVKRPLFPLEFFLKLASLPHGRLIVVKKEKQVIGGMACVIDRNKTLYEWFVCGNETTDKKLYPSVMATWAGVGYAVQNKIEKFDFMGAGKPDEDYGVREFKSKFGGELVENGRLLYVISHFLYKIGIFALKVRSKL